MRDRSILADMTSVMPVVTVWTRGGVNSQLRLCSLRCLVRDMADVAHLLASRVVQVDNPDGCLAGNLDRLGHEGRERV